MTPEVWYIRFEVFTNSEVHPGIKGGRLFLLKMYNARKAVIKISILKHSIIKVSFNNKIIDINASFTSHILSYRRRN